jgi:hypothetical protein
MRTSVLFALLGTPSVQYDHDYYVVALEDGATGPIGAYCG